MSASVESLVVNTPFKMLQHRSEIVPFGDWILQQRIGNVLEIGTGPGGTTAVIGQLISGLIVSVDLPTRGAIDVHNQLGMALQNFRSALGDSSKPATLEFIRGLLPDPIDLLFIDGDHRYEYVKKDFKTYKQFVRPGGFVAFHDINASSKWPDMGVPKFWNELKGKKKEFLAGPFSDEPASWGGIGVVQL